MGRDMAAELLRSLFSSDRKPAQNKPEWKCEECGTMNFMDRKRCRYCQTSSTPQITKQKQPKSGGMNPTNTKPPALAPWASAEMIQERAELLESAIAATEAAGGCTKSVLSLQRELETQRKKESKPIPVLQQIDSTKGFISRAKTRHSQIEENIAELDLEKAAMEKEIKKAQERLKTMEKKFLRY